ncbi:hypothetical protein [Mastigocoleus testarum]|nr:hypothetical protein [Mastigocoleus testarum]
MNQNQLPKRYHLWFERFMAIIAAINLGFVLFDLSYVPWRTFYFRNLPKLTQVYDPVKGIEPHRDTQNYLQVVNRLQNQISNTGLQSSQVKATLEDLKNLSVEMIEENPFASASKSGTLEKIKNRMRAHIGDDSAKEAFRIFWSQEYLSKQSFTKEIGFFARNIKPLIASNYYRRIGENGEYIDRFWLYDLPIVLLFTLDLIVRSYFIKRRHSSFSWLNAILWHWYDAIFLIPAWRWLRIIPVAFRLDKAQLLKLHGLRRQIEQGIVANFAEEITQMVVIRVIDQTQQSIHNGDLTRWLKQSRSVNTYVDINNINEIEAISGIVVKATVHQVLPKIQPEIVALLRHSIDSALNQSPIYRNLHSLPGMGEMQTQLSEKLATEITTNLHKALVSAVEDPVAAQLSSRLIQRFGESLGDEIQRKKILTEIQSLLFDFLEEVKINYVQRLSQEDMEQILEKTRQLKNQVSVPAVVKQNSTLVEMRKIK